MRPIRSLSAAAALCLVMAACGSGPATTPTPSASPSASPIPSTQPLATPATPLPSLEPSISVPGDSVPIPPDTYARVVTNDLRVRSKPGVSEDSQKLEPLLQDDTLVVVLDGPVQASGYDWYLVQPTRDFQQNVEYPFGWVAAADKDGEPWIASEHHECPPLPHDVATLASVSPSGRTYEEITCFGGKEITFQARIARPEAWCGVSPSWTWEPSWFSACEQASYPLYPVEANDGPIFQPAWSPDVDTSMAGDPSASHDKWPIVEVTGQFDHPAATTCRNVQLDTDVPEPDPAQTIVNCRIQFVVTSMTEIDG